MWALPCCAPTRTHMYMYVYMYYIYTHTHPPARAQDDQAGEKSSEEKNEPRDMLAVPAVCAFLSMHV